MTIVKWKKPYSTDGLVNSPAIFNSPFSGLFENLIGENFLNKEYASFVPAVNISEENNNYSIELAAPGFNKEDFKIEQINGMLTIAGQHKSEKEVKEKNFSRKEFAFGSFQRSFSLPEEINEDSIEAKYENGILTILFSKREETKKVAREIKIS
jgi:HSP20 family protein